MKYLLDTHVFIWLANGEVELPNRITALLLNRDNQLYLSILTVWEMQIKHQLGKLDLVSDVEEIVSEQQHANDLLMLSIQEKHIYTLKKLPMLHKDAFDRLLIAQAFAEQMTLITGDATIKEYDVPIVWD